MSEMRQKIGRIIDELIIFQFNAGAEDIHMDLHRRPDGMEICFTSQCSDGQDMEKQVDRLNRYLKVGRNEAIEAYFWGLAGEDEDCHNSELQLIGQMVDQSDARLENGQLIMKVFRKND